MLIGFNAHVQYSVGAVYIVILNLPLVYVTREKSRLYRQFFCVTPLMFQPQER